MRQHRFTFPLRFLCQTVLWQSWAAGDRDWFPMPGLYQGTRIRSLIKHCESLADLSAAQKLSLDIDAAIETGVLVFIFHLPN